MNETLEEALMRIRFDNSIKCDEEKWAALCEWAEKRGILPSESKQS